MNLNLAVSIAMVVSGLAGPAVAQDKPQLAFVVTSPNR